MKISLKYLDAYVAIDRMILAFENKDAREITAWNREYLNARDKLNKRECPIALTYFENIRICCMNYIINSNNIGHYTPKKAREIFDELPIPNFI